MTAQLNIGSSLRICLAVLILAVAVTSACQALLPSVAGATTMSGHGSGQHGDMGGQLPSETLPELNCCWQVPSTATTLDRVDVSLPVAPPVIMPAECAGSQPVPFVNESPPGPPGAATPLRL